MGKKTNYKEAGDELIKVLTLSEGYMTYCSSLSIHVYMNSSRIDFIINLGGHFVPKKEDCKPMLMTLNKHFEKVSENSPAFLDFIGDRDFEAWIVADSGHMNMNIASMIKGKIAIYISQ